MASLKEIKGRINSVDSTLKITSAMKMVASAKLRKAQNAIGNMVPYQNVLRTMLVNLLMDKESASLEGMEGDGALLTRGRDSIRSVALVCFSSNTSLCGAFNANAIKAATKAVKDYEAAGVKLTVYSIGRKMADAMRKLGYPSPYDYTSLSANPDYEVAAALGQELEDGYISGRFDKVEVIYNHFKSTSSQPTVHEPYLPIAISAQSVGTAEVTQPDVEPVDYIVEPDNATILQELIPKVVRLKIYTILLDTQAAEHAARTVAMQTATDNGQDLLAELTLEYNKGRQQKITTEILDLASGSQQ